MSIRRILDAEFNRAREALRVIEDFARFVRDSKPLTHRAKTLRHELRSAYDAAGGDAANLGHRDTPGDVGTGIQAADEGRRESADAVLTANFKRLGESLRSLEEFSKVVSPAGPCFERLRYDAYTLEREFARRPPRFETVRLYVILTESLCRRPIEETARAVLEGGADCIQLREKTMPDGKLLELAVRLAKLVHEHGKLFIVNDRPDIAVLSGADGVHVGQTELPVSAARKIVGPDALVGLSTHNVEQARAAVSAGADCIGVGPMFPSSTKPRDFVAGAAYLKQVVDEIPIPHVAIAGITLDNLDTLLAVGCRCAAVCSAIISQDDPGAAARAFRAWMG